MSWGMRTEESCISEEDFQLYQEHDEVGLKVAEEIRIVLDIRALVGPGGWELLDVLLVLTVHILLGGR